MEVLEERLLLYLSFASPPSASAYPISLISLNLLLLISISTTTVEGGAGGLDLDLEMVEGYFVPYRRRAVHVARRTPYHCCMIATILEWYDSENRCIRREIPHIHSRTIPLHPIEVLNTECLSYKPTFRWSFFGPRILHHADDNTFVFPYCKQWKKLIRLLPVLPNKNLCLTVRLWSVPVFRSVVDNLHMWMSTSEVTELLDRRLW